MSMISNKDLYLNGTFLNPTRNIKDSSYKASIIAMFLKNMAITEIREKWQNIIKLNEKIFTLAS